jgi:hypothetical protein
MTTKQEEQFAIGDLRNNAVSDITAGTLWDRQHGGGTDKVSLLAAEQRGDQLYLHYQVFPTYSMDSVRILTNGSEMPAKYYDALFQFDKMSEQFPAKEAFEAMSKPEQLQVLRDYLDNGMCRVNCSCGAFYYQGHWEDMAKLDSVVFPFPGPKGDGIWAAKHAAGLKQAGISICKHLASCIDKIDKRDLPEIVKKIKLLH